MLNLLLVITGFAELSMNPMYAVNKQRSIAQSACGDEFNSWSETHK